MVGLALELYSECLGGMYAFIVIVKDSLAMDKYKREYISVYLDLSISICLERFRYRHFKSL